LVPACALHRRHSQCGEITVALTVRDSFEKALVYDVGKWHGDTRVVGCGKSKAYVFQCQ
jgi:hypothetical protein